MKREFPDSLLCETEEIVRRAGRLFFEKQYSENVYLKGRADFVTDADYCVQEFLKGELGSLLPDIEFMSEEKDNSDLDFDRPVWILDPVDGTTNLIHGFCHSTISLALEDCGEIRMGIVFDPYHDEMFTAVKDGGAFLNGERISVPPVAGLEESLVSVGTAPGCREEAAHTFRIMRMMYDVCHDIRRIGSASLEMCYVAAGRLNGYIENGLKPWDYAAASIIVREAGGDVRTFDGGEISLRERCGIVASGARLMPQLLDVIERARRDLY